MNWFVHLRGCGERVSKQRDGLDAYVTFIHFAKEFPLIGYWGHIEQLGRKFDGSLSSQIHLYLDLFFDNN